MHTFPQRANVLFFLAVLVTVIGLSGLSAGQSLSCSPCTLSFGNVSVGQSKTLALNLHNAGRTTVTISRVTSSKAEYKIGNLNLPVTVGAGQNISVQVQFTPVARGSDTGYLAVSSTARNRLTYVSLSGTGISPTPSTGSLSASPTNLAFGNVSVGSNKLLALSFRNSGSAAVTISKINSSLSAYSIANLQLPATVPAGGSVQASVRFSPTTQALIRGYLIVSSNARNSTMYVVVSGTGTSSGGTSTSASLVANPTSLSFGNVQVGASKSMSASLQNNGSSGLTISQATVSGTGFGFGTTALSLPMTLAAGQSVTFTVSFTPRASGASAGTVTVVSTALQVAISLSGSGMAAGQLAVSPATMSFGNVVVGSSKSLTGTISASGSSVVISSAGTNSAEFAMSGLTLPLTLAAGQSTSFTLAFKPASSGTASAVASFVSNAANSPATEALTGTGAVSAPVTQHSVNLSWTESSSGVAGFNVYRGTQSGGPYSKLNSALDTATAYSDATVVSGQTYYYVVTSVGSTGTESGYSNEAVAPVP